MEVNCYNYDNGLNRNKWLYMTIEFLEKKILEASTPKDFRLALKRIDALMESLHE